MNLTEQLYSLSPIWIQNLLISMKGWQYRHNRASDKLIHKNLEFLMKSQHWSNDQFREYQNESFKKVIKTAFNNIEYYKDLQKKSGISLDDIKTIEDINLLPFLEKKQLRGNENKFINQNIKNRNCTQISTSGTTGTPIKILESQESWSKRWAFVCRLHSWAGLMGDLYPRRVQFTGRDIVPINQKRTNHTYWRYNYPGKSLLMSTSHLTSEMIPEYIEEIIKYNPLLIDGYPSAMLIISEIAKRKKIKLPKPKAIITTAETLFLEDKEKLELAFKCKVYNQYAASEPSCFWCECEYGRMHINPEYGISEIVDSKGDHVAPGETGEIVVTSFLNHVMPLIRYRIGDLATLSSEKSCECGRNMPIIEKVVGRIDDILFIPEGGYIGRLDPVFKGIGNIIESQIIQESLENIRILIVPDEFYNQKVENYLRQNLRAKLGDKIDIVFELASSIPRGSNGKFKSVVSKINRNHLDKEFMSLIQF